MRITQESIFFCKDYSQDIESEQLSAFTLIDGVEVESFPADIGALSLIAKFAITDSPDEDYIKVRFEIRDPNNEITSPNPRDFNMPVYTNMPFTKSGMVLKLPEIHAPSEGIYRLIVSHEGNQIGEFAFNVSLEESSDE